MRLSLVIHVAGRILRILGMMFLAPIVVAMIYGESEDVGGFVLADAITVVLAQAMVRASRETAEDLRRIEALAVVSGTWLVVAQLGAIPYMWVGLSPIDALFESMSGFTTTGATILVDFEQLGRGMLFWRSMSQWLGGMGVITLFVAVLPRLAFGVRQLFFTEAPGPTGERLTPHIRQTAAYLWQVYAGAHAGRVDRSVSGRDAAVRRGLPLDDHARGWRFLAQSRVDHGIPERWCGVDHLRVHVPGRRELCAAISRAAGPTWRAAQG